MLWKIVYFYATPVVICKIDGVPVLYASVTTSLIINQNRKSLPPKAPKQNL